MTAAESSVHPIQCEAPEDEKPKGDKHNRPAIPGDSERERSAPTILLSDEHGTVPLGISERVTANRSDRRQILGIRIPQRAVLYHGAIRST